MAKKKTKIAIVYDFDGTLAKGNIQENSFIPEIGMANDKFWSEVKKRAKNHEMDEILAYMYLLIKKAEEKEIKVDKESFSKHGQNVQYFDGVEEYFDAINSHAEENEIALEHYIISSGTKEMLDGTSIAKQFKKIFASSFMYDQNGVAKWPAIAINYTTKTQFLFRINKGIDNSWNNDKINKYVQEADRPVPFDHMIYIGDGDTDIPAMKMVNYQGGNSIAVYPPNKNGARRKAQQLLKEGRATYVAVADYSSDKEIVRILKALIESIKAKDSIKSFSDG